MKATVVRALFSTQQEDPTELLSHLLHRRVIDLCPQPDRGLQFIAWCLQQSSDEQTSGVCIWARAAPPQRPRMSTWQKIFPGAVIEPMQAQQWLRTLTSRAQHSGLFCSPATVNVFSAYKGVAGGTPVLNIQQHIQDITPQLQSPATRTPVDLRPSQSCTTARQSCTTAIPSKAEVSLMSVKKRKCPQADASEGGIATDGVPFASQVSERETAMRLLCGAVDDAFQLGEQVSSPQKQPKLQGAHRNPFEWTPQACVWLLEGVRQTSFVSPCSETLNAEVGDGGYMGRMRHFMSECLRESIPARLWGTLAKNFGPTEHDIRVKLNSLMIAYGRDHKGFNDCERACIHAVSQGPGSGLESATGSSGRGSGSGRAEASGGLQPRKTLALKCACKSAPCDRLLVNATACKSTMTLDSVTKEAEAACESTEEQKEKNTRAEMCSAEEGGGGGRGRGKEAPRRQKAVTHFKSCPYTLSSTA